MKYRDNEPVEVKVNVPRETQDTVVAIDSGPIVIDVEGNVFTSIEMDIAMPVEFARTKEPKAKIHLANGEVKLEDQSSNVVDMNAYRPCPHVVLRGKKIVHVLPVSLIEDVLYERFRLSAIDPELMRDILRDWLTQVQADQDDGK